jgi:hypothetical protein
MRSSRVLGGIALAILVALVLVWRLAASSGGAAAVSGDAPASSAGPVSLARGSAPRGGSAEAAADAPGGAQRDALARSAAPAPTCRIRVVRADSRAPVPEAHVWLQREDVEVSSPAWQETMRRFNDVEPVLQGGLGDELVLDARGEALVPRPTHRRCVAAARGELHGDATLQRETWSASSS